jgi:tetratricopeptide (TPR) repeat protein
MATLERDDANIVDVERIDWRLIVYPVLAALVIIVGGFGYYYYQQNQRMELESTARTALLGAKTPADWIKVADTYPHTNQGTLALLDAGEASFAANDYPAAIKSYQRVVDAADTDPVLRDSAQLGLAAALQASGKQDDAAQGYLIVARRGMKSPYSPFAYMACVAIYKERGQIEIERAILAEAAALASDSMFVKEAQYSMKQFIDAAQPPVSVSTPTVLPSAPSPAPAPAK